MPGLEDVSYSEAACVAAVGRYYEFLVKMYLDDSEVIYPPEGGWPSITGADPEALAKFGKSDKVISLLAHLPFLRHQPDIHGIAGCKFADWSALFTGVTPESDMEAKKIVTEGSPFNELAPPHVVSLTRGGRDTPVILVDTELGVITWDAYPYPKNHNHAREPIHDDPYDYAPDEEAEWRAEGMTWAIDDFFEVLKSLFLDLFYIPISRKLVIGDFEGFGHPQGMISTLRGIYHAHGWPNLSAYRKDECLDAVVRAMKAKYPAQSAWC